MANSFNPNDPYGINGDYQDAPDGTGLSSLGTRFFDNTNQQSAYGVPGSAVTGGAAGYVGSGGGIGKTGGFLGIGNENVQQQLAASGYRMYTPTATPNDAGLFQTNQSPELQFRSGEVDLMNALRGQVGGTGPSAATGTLMAGRDANAANLMAAMASGRGSPGSSSGAFMASATAGQQAANQAAILRAEEIASAQGALGGVTQAGAAGDLGEQQLRATQGAGLAGIDQGNWQYLNSLNANQQGQLNSNINQAVQGANSSQQAMVGQGISAVAGAAAAAAAAAHGAVVDKPTLFVAGEAGREAIVPIHRDGTPDMKRATDPQLKWLLEHPGTAGREAKDSGMPTTLPHHAQPLPAKAPSPMHPVLKAILDDHVATTRPIAHADHGILGQIYALRQEIAALREGR